MKSDRKDIVDETAAVVERLRAAYTSWNNPPSDGLPEGAEVVLEAADLLERLSRERGIVPEGRMLPPWEKLGIEMRIALINAFSFGASRALDMIASKGRSDATQ